MGGGRVNSHVYCQIVDQSTITQTDDWNITDLVWGINLPPYQVPQFNE